jgi:radical SAM superfamily enzyme YgiQ (UPF0313 family)
MIHNIILVEPKNERLNIFSKYELPRLGTILLATIMKKKGFNAQVLFMRKKDVLAQDLEPDLVGISTITPTAPNAYALGDHYRRKGIPVVMGGPHVTFMPEEALDHADYVIMGEGEISFPMLVSALNGEGSLDDVPGLAWKAGGIVKKNPIGKSITDLDQIPIADLSLMVTRKNRFENPFARKKIPIQTSRGCPFDCNFCSVTQMFGKKYRFRSMENIITEIEKYDPKKHYFFFYDDNFTANRKRAKALLQEMIDRKLGFNWSTQVRCDIAKDPELLDLMKKAGCAVLFIGFESVDPESLVEMKKSQTVADIEYAIKEIRKRNIHVHGMFVLGFDSDTRKKTMATVDFAIKNKIDTVQFSILTPLPGTEFHKKMTQENRIIDCKWDEYDAHHVKFRPLHFTEWELQMSQLIAHTRFYASHQVFMRLFRGKILAFLIGLYANSLNRQWQRIERQYLKALKTMFGDGKVFAKT